MEQRDIIGTLRLSLKPQGIAPYVCIRTTSLGGMYLHQDFVAQCIDELEKMPVRAAVQEPSALEKLAFMLLCESAYIDPQTPRS